jgi:novel protein kinase C epsilon type
VHKRCKNNVANNCGINARQLADILNDMGMTPHMLNESSKPAKKKVLNIGITIVQKID